MIVGIASVHNAVFLRLCALRMIIWYLYNSNSHVVFSPELHVLNPLQVAAFGISVLCIYKVLFLQDFIHCTYMTSFSSSWASSSYHLQLNCLLPCNQYHK